MFAVANIVERFADRFDFYVVAGNRNARQSSERIAGVTENEWENIGSAKVFFTLTTSLNSTKLLRLFDESRPDVVFLNSVFSTPTIRFLRARKTGNFLGVPVIIAPCGELMPEALAIKSWKKRTFLIYARGAGLYRGLIWRASFESERKSIKAVFGEKVEVRIAADLTPKTILPDFDASLKPEKRPGHSKFVFLARVVRNKNLHFFLERLRDIHEGKIEVELIGPIEDKQYWDECLRLIGKLPANIRVTSIGAVNNAEALRRLTNAHFFVLPTLTENFGFVFIEALAAGCPLLISERTDWGRVEDAEAGWILRLENRDAWRERIVQCISLDQHEYNNISAAARKLALNWFNEPGHEAATAELLEEAVGSSERQ